MVQISLRTLGRKFHYGRSTAPPPPAKASLVRPNASFYLLTYLMGRVAYLGHFGHLAMVRVPIGLVMAGLNLKTWAHKIGDLFPFKWVPDSYREQVMGVYSFQQPSYLPSIKAPLILDCPTQGKP
ncbi:hypothetical protein DSO57_1037552 [Entomophthora muscae]|uniref:Uncharacterized protein n=1 Tax=Entomophthora muscae TaxID=34485 RepID=A0ACC2SZA3_9FUNG|nr:hypothetical protein DSO57_1037552 [Entomophthora muscae]